MKKQLLTFKWKYFFVLLISFLCMMSLMRYSASQVNVVSNGTDILDLNFGNSTSYIKQTLDNLGTAGRSYYLHNFFLVDLFYPITYACFYGYSLLFFLNKSKLKISWHIAFLPFIGMLFDWLENLFIILLIINYPSLIDSLCIASSLATILKFVMVYASLLLVIILLLITTYKYFTSRILHH